MRFFPCPVCKETVNLDQCEMSTVGGIVIPGTPEGPDGEPIDHYHCYKCGQCMACGGRKSDGETTGVQEG